MERSASAFAGNGGQASRIRQPGSGNYRRPPAASQRIPSLRVGRLGQGGSLPRGAPGVPLDSRDGVRLRHGPRLPVGAGKHAAGGRPGSEGVCSQGNRRRLPARKRQRADQSRGVSALLPETVWICHAARPEVPGPFVAPFGGSRFDTIFQSRSRALRKATIYRLAGLTLEISFCVRGVVGPPWGTPFFPVAFRVI